MKVGERKVFVFEEGNNSNFSLTQLKIQIATIVGNIAANVFVYTSAYYIYMKILTFFMLSILFIHCVSLFAKIYLKTKKKKID